MMKLIYKRLRRARNTISNLIVKNLINTGSYADVSYLLHDGSHLMILHHIDASLQLRGHAIYSRHVNWNMVMMMLSEIIVARR